MVPWFNIGEIIWLRREGRRSTWWNSVWGRTGEAYNNNHLTGWSCPLETLDESKYSNVLK